MNCDKCNSKRVMSIGSKCSDNFNADCENGEYLGYVPDDLGVGNGDYIEFSYCMDCGKLQGKFPLPISNLEKDVSDEELLEFYSNFFSEGQKLGIKRHLMFEIVDSAKNYCDRLRNFMQWFFNENNDPSGRHPAIMPSAEKFVQMYRINDPGLED